MGALHGRTADGRPLQQPSSHLVIEKLLPVLGESDRRPDRIIRTQPHKRATQQLVVEPLWQQLLRADPMNASGDEAPCSGIGGSADDRTPASYSA